MHRSGQVTKGNRITESRSCWEAAESILWYHPGASHWIRKSFSKLGRSLHVTEEAVYTDSSKGSYLVINMIIQSGTTENSAFVIRKDSKGVFYVIGICLLKQTASGAQSVTSPSKIEGFREFEADLSALFCEEDSKRKNHPSLLRSISGFIA